MRKHRFAAGLLALCLASAGLSACSGQQNAAAGTEAAGSGQTAGFPRTIKHVKGELELKEKPERVASVDIMGTDYFLVLGVAPIVSEGFEGTKAKSPIFAKYAEGMKVGDLGSKTNRETLLEMDPQVIVMTSTGKGASYDEFNKLAPSIAVDFSLDAASRLMKFAEIVGKEEKAKQVIADFEKLKSEAKAAVAGHKGETALFLVANGKDFTVMHPKNFPIYYEELGLTPVAGLPEDGKIGGRIGIEALSEFKPDHIFIAANRREMKAEDPLGLISIWKDHPVWNNLKAVKENRVYPIDTLAGDTFFLGQVAGLQAIKDHLGTKK
ncbi:iron-uptake system-binding protein [Paenibacillus tyrfis]|uniref:ABC transporter substrate-binding protein n=1 Tax=Paenibacillus tyrfis TaxID=1501230 RepID=UPI00248F5744|nr:ABC transporter substrate-binding protein [Paenibacillus tyrfis]GLI04757.1 iron-uptake system-binding protein [Paenibacillus tyrfis]